LSVQAFTNEVGSHYHFTTYADSVEYIEYRRGSGASAVYESRKVLTPHQMPDGFSFKQAPFKALNKPSDYFRFAQRVTSNKPFSLKYRRWNRAGNYWEVWYVKSEHLPTFYYEPFSVPFPLEWVDETVNKSVVKALNSIAGDSAQVGAAVAESRETGEMLGKAASQLLQAYRAARRNDWRSVAHHLQVDPKNLLTGKTIKDRWLEYQYGWKPLTQDIHDLALTGLSQIRKSTTKQLRHYSGASWTDQSEYDLRGVHVRNTFSVSARTTFIATLENHFLSSLSDFGLINPLAVAWEVVPFSFMVDWFVPVGNVLQAYTATSGLRNDGGWTSIHRKQLTHVQLSESPSFNDGVTEDVVTDRGDFSETSFAFERIAYAEWPQPRFYGNPTPWSTPHVLNALALMR
jgi:hypothetical protein